MKKLFSAVLVLSLAVCCVFAGNFKFIFKDMDQHPEIVGGFVPTLIEIGVGYGDKNQVQATVGGGYTQRIGYQNPLTGEPLKSNQLIYDATQYRWNLKVVHNAEVAKFQVYGGYEGRYEINSDSIVKGKERFRGYNADGKKGKTVVPSIDDWFNNPEFGTSLAESTIYPDIAGDKKALINGFYAGLVFNPMDDQMVTNDGFIGELKVQYVPIWINKEADFLSTSLNLVSAKTLYQKKLNSGFNAFSFVLIDRFNANWTDGTKVPGYISRPVSLGRKVRGFGTNSYNTNFSFVNNFELRIAGPEILHKGIFPRINLFVDLGYHFGNYFNTGHNGVKAVEGKHFLASTGAQFEASFFDIIDLGFEVSYLICGENWKTPGERIITGATFFLDF